MADLRYHGATIPGPDGEPNYTGPLFLARPPVKSNRFSDFSSIEWAWLKVAMREYVASYGVGSPPVGLTELMKELSGE